jgi:hypothetical protein
MVTVPGQGPSRLSRSDPIDNMMTIRVGPGPQPGCPGPAARRPGPRAGHAPRLAQRLIRLSHGGRLTVSTDCGRVWPVPSDGGKCSVTRPGTGGQ